ncbi:MAG: phage baseplate protein, partial [Leptotrichia sp.]|nr:phage baseplate protein [Leptotrichia sp.]
MLEILKAGEVSAIDYKTGKVRVLFSAGDNKTSDWLN